MELHRYRGRQDLARLLAFCSAATAARAPSRPPWHPGELAWELRGHFDEDRALYAVVRDGSVVGALSLQSENMIFDVLPRDASLLPRVLDAAIKKARDAGFSRLETETPDDDCECQAALAAAAFTCARPGWVLFERDLIRNPPAMPHISGFRFRDCVGIDAEARAGVHRAAWSALGYMGITRESKFSADDYLSLAVGGAYDPRFDIIAEACDGRLAGSATAWADRASGVAVFEPVGVAPEFRGSGVASAMMAEAMNRLARGGMRRAHVLTPHYNAAALGAYGKAFDRAGSTSIWTRVL